MEETCRRGQHFSRGYGKRNWYGGDFLQVDGWNTHERQH